MKRKRVLWDSENRARVQSLAGFGLTDRQIAEHVGCAESTLQKHCAGELAKGRVLAQSQVAQTCFRMAVSGKVPAATFFWLKCRARWREKDREEDQAELPVSPILDHDEG